MRRLFGTDGIRGVVGTELTVELAMKIGRAVGCALTENQRHKAKIVIGRDTRISSEMLSSAMAAGIFSSGADVIDVGIVPTPAVAYLVIKNNAEAGVMISASHNPYEYNGIKVFGGDGFKLSDELEEKIESTVFSESMAEYAPKDRIGRSKPCEFCIGDYVTFLKSNARRLDGMRIGIDCANGSTAYTAKAVFSDLGAECIFIGDAPNGVNINEGCGSTHLSALSSLVIRKGLDVGIAFDGDGDRCLAVNEKGEECDGDFIMAILAGRLKEQGKLSKNTVVGTVMSNLGLIKFCEKEKITYLSAKVGDRYVLELINQEGYNFGGEQSGHIILRELATTGDGQLTAALLLSAMSESGKRLSELMEVMKKYPQHSVNIPATKDEKISLFVDTRIKEEIRKAEEELGDGRLIVRPSGTEPLIRVMAEGREPENTREVAEQVAQRIRLLLQSSSP